MLSRADGVGGPATTTAERGSDATRATQPAAARPGDYESSPPAGGRHFPVWLDYGVYDEQVRDELTVHDPEHAAFWFAYDPAALDVDEVAALGDQLPDNGIMTPYDGLEAPVGVTAPEPFASCAGGASLADIADLALPTDVAAG